MNLLALIAAAVFTSCAVGAATDAAVVSASLAAGLAVMFFGIFVESVSRR